MRLTCADDLRRTSVNTPQPPWQWGDASTSPCVDRPKARRSVGPPTGAGSGQSRARPPGTGIWLSTDVLDRTDELVAPGVTVNPDDNGYSPHELTPAAGRA